MVLWSIVYHYCTTSFIKVWIEGLRSFKSCPWHGGGWQLFPSKTNPKDGSGWKCGLIQIIVQPFCKNNHHFIGDFRLKTWKDWPLLGKCSIWQLRHSEHRFLNPGGILYSKTWNCLWLLWTFLDFLLDLCFWDSATESVLIFWKT